MNKEAFEQLSVDLRNLAVKIPLRWGAIQNNRDDDVISMFSIHSFSQLENELSQAMIDNTHKDYIRRRWYLWKCSLCDEYLFYRNDRCRQNPNPYDKGYDIIIDKPESSTQIPFDVKGTVIPREMRNNVEGIILNPRPIVDFFYRQQSTGRRYDIQNRLFIVHHSFVDTKRELLLRCAWQSKQLCYERFVTDIHKVHLIPFQNVQAAIIFILERELGKVEWLIY